MNPDKVIGVGFTATVYEWEEGKVLKLFRQDFPKEAIEMEFRNARAVMDLPFSKPKAYELIHLDGRLGIVYDLMEGESLFDWVLRTGDLQQCAIYMAELHKSILDIKVESVNNYKDCLRYFISGIPDISEREGVLRILDRLPEGNTLCHGDFHPGNILLNQGTTCIIDFMNICHGHYLYDVARTVYLVQYTPVYEEGEMREQLLRFKKSLADLYLIQMQVTREMIRDYLTVIKAARRIECPEEKVD